MNDNFYDGLSREEVCRYYANDVGEKHNFTDKDYSWLDEYELAKNMSDNDLLYWCRDNL